MTQVFFITYVPYHVTCTYTHSFKNFYLNILVVNNNSIFQKYFIYVCVYAYIRVQVPTEAIGSIGSLRAGITDIREPHVGAGI